MAIITKQKHENLLEACKGLEKAGYAEYGVYNGNGVYYMSADTFPDFGGCDYEVSVIYTPDEELMGILLRSEVQWVPERGTWGAIRECAPGFDSQCMATELIDDYRRLVRTIPKEEEPDDAEFFRICC